MPAATTPSVAVTWTLGTGCAASTPCAVTVYRIAGTCPAQITGTATWTAIPLTGTQAVAYTDTSVSFGQTYSYVVEDVSNVGGHANLNPAANCYLNVMGGSTTGSSGWLTFNPTSCYTASPSAPSRLSVTVNTFISSGVNLQ